MQKLSTAKRTTTKTDSTIPIADMNNPTGVNSLWAGDQVSRAPWFNARLKEAADVFEYKTLVKHGTVSTPRGETACFSPEHAMEHLTKANVGDWRKPNLTMRQPYTTSGLAATTPSMTATTHRGYPGTPSSSAPPTRSSLLSILGDHASEYKLAPDLIEERDLQFFNFFADSISNPRLKNHYKKVCSDSGRQFITTCMQEMEDDGSSLTAEDTVEARMRAILTGGLSEATYECYSTVVDE